VGRSGSKHSSGRAGSPTASQMLIKGYGHRPQTACKRAHSRRHTRFCASAREGAPLKFLSRLSHAHPSPASRDTLSDTSRSGDRLASEFMSSCAGGIVSWKTTCSEQRRSWVAVTLLAPPIDQIERPTDSRGRRAGRLFAMLRRRWRRGSGARPHPSPAADAVPGATRRTRTWWRQAMARSSPRRAAIAARSCPGRDLVAWGRLIVRRREPLGFSVRGRDRDASVLKRPPLPRPIKSMPAPVAYSGLSVVQAPPSGYRAKGDGQRLLDAPSSAW
jgi:hypothetical protein